MFACGGNLSLSQHAILFLLGLVLFHLQAVQGCFGALTCGPGHYYHEELEGIEGKEGHCVQCKPGYFMDETEHRKPWCNKCSVFDGERSTYLDLVLLDQCTIFHDIKVGCVDNFYLEGEDDCHACTNCVELGKVEAKPCTRHSDTVCCDPKMARPEDGKCVELFDPNGMANVTKLEVRKPCPIVPKDCQCSKQSKDAKSQQKCDGVCFPNYATVVLIALGVSLTAVVFFFVGRSTQRYRLL